jgi:hypothetical protein
MRIVRSPIKRESRPQTERGCRRTSGCCTPIPAWVLSQPRSAASGASNSSTRASAASRSRRRYRRRAAWPARPADRQRRAVGWGARRRAASIEVLGPGGPCGPPRRLNRAQPAATVGRIAGGCSAPAHAPEARQRWGHSDARAREWRPRGRAGRYPIGGTGSSRWLSIGSRHGICLVGRAGVGRRFGRGG